MSIKTQRLIAEIRRLAKPTPPPPPPAAATPAVSTPDTATVAPGGQTPPPAPPPVAPATPVPASADKSTTSSKPAVPTTPITPSASPIIVQKTVKEMQDAIQSFASTVTHYHTKRSPQSGKLTPISTKPTGPTESDSFSYFNDFITLNYLNSSPIRGNEWSTDEGANTAGEKNPVYDDKLIQMRNVVDNIVRIGSSRSERDPDGQWNWRTQNALRDLYAFGDALIRLSEDFSSLTQAADIFTKSDLQTMRAQIPTNDQLKTMKPNDKLSKAKKLTLLIGKLTKFYYYFANTVIKHPAYRRFTDKAEAARSPLYRQAPLSGKDKGDTSSYQDLMRNIDSLYLPNMTIKASDGSVKIINQFPIKALKEPYLLKEIMIRFGGYISNEINRQMQIDFLNDIMKQIDRALSSGKYQGYQAPPQPDSHQRLIDQLVQRPMGELDQDTRTPWEKLRDDALRRGRK
jgi:hypothetical protein